MKVKITFEKPDDVLASLIRGIVAQIEGYQRVSGQTNLAMWFDGLSFDFNTEESAKRFERALNEYLSMKALDKITISLISN